MSSRRLFAAPSVPFPAPPRGARSRVRGASPLAAGGLIAIGGQPLGGKSVLAARLAECIPFCVRLEAIDDLSRARPFLSRRGSRRIVRDTTADLLQDARRLWRERSPGAAPTILLVTRFATAAERRRAKVAARLAGMRFLFVEARSRDDRALRRLPSAFVTRAELEKRLARYEKARAEYRAIERAESLILPSLCLQRVQSELDAAVDQVLGAWSGL